MLELKDINYRPATSKKAILKGISFNAHKGIPVLIAGASGSGKTSLMEVTSGIAKQNTGCITWNTKVLSRRQRRWLCGVVFQFPERHFLGLTIAQELRLGHKRLSSVDQAKALKEVGLDSVNLRMPPERLSGGQQRRLALAVQLLRKPKVLILDEPTAGLDWSVRGEVLQLLKKISHDKVLIIVTHEIEQFESWNAPTYKLHEGKIELMRKSAK